MAKYLMLGKYSLESIKGISAGRTKKAVALIEKHGGKVNSVYALLGQYDLAIMADFGGVADVMEASVDLTKLTAISFTTLPALSVDVFDRIMS